MPYPYKKVLMVGASSGIGHSLTTRILADTPDAHVVVVARRIEPLQALQQQHGADRVTPVQFDITKLDEIPQFTKEQRGFFFTRPETVDLTLFDTEMRTNFTAAAHLATAFLPHLLARPSPSSIIFTSSNLAVIPFPVAAAYSASKAALHAFTLSLRLQLEDTAVRVIELFPPAVQTELHDPRHQPHLAEGTKLGMPLDAFADAAYVGLSARREQVVVGAPEGLEAFEDWRQGWMRKFWALVRAGKAGMKPF
ncbi:hypothetical protein DV736_g2289, partial [Chaetothyriales sp. CBS 134916]